MSTEPKRKDVKKAVLAKVQEDPEFKQALEQAQNASLEHTKEENAHAVRMHELNLGKLGKFFGDGRNTATFIALTCVLLSFLGIYFLGKESIEEFIGIIMAAMGYIFGKKFGK